MSSRLCLAARGNVQLRIVSVNFLRLTFTVHRSGGVGLNASQQREDRPLQANGRQAAAGQSGARPPHSKALTLQGVGADSKS